MTELYQIYLSSRQVQIDSRLCQTGDLFFALRGERDGHAFVEKALANGAAYAVVDDPVMNDNPQCLWVRDSLTALQDLARHHRRMLNPLVFALTGSNGKTTTKELLAAVLSKKFKIHATPGNFNNHIGVPLTLLGMPEDTEIAIIEMGANAQKEIASLCEIAEPDLGLITNIGLAHLEGFGGPEGVKKGKGELYHYLKDGNKPFIYLTNEEAVTDLARHYPGAVPITIGDHLAPGIGKIVSAHPGLVMDFMDHSGSTFEVSSQLFGPHNACNIALAVAVGWHFGVTNAEISAAINAYIPGNNRSQQMDFQGNKIILDAYNANPISMEMALKSLMAMPGEPKMAILGDMLELGSYSETAHQKIGTQLSSYPSLKVVLVGPEMGKIPMETTWQWFENIQALKSWFATQNIKDHTLLIKGSRGLALEKLLE
jgi:UDP-N-acetylmuramoyl-tripeptide--D-alanyl-D-alanine ligase